jgi:hypothetical protein
VFRDRVLNLTPTCILPRPHLNSMLELRTTQLTYNLNRGRFLSIYLQRHLPLLLTNHSPEPVRLCPANHKIFKHQYLWLKSMLRQMQKVEIFILLEIQIMHTTVHSVHLPWLHIEQHKRLPSHPLEALRTVHQPHPIHLKPNRDLTPNPSPTLLRPETPSTSIT